MSLSVTTVYRLSAHANILRVHSQTAYENKREKIMRVMDNAGPGSRRVTIG